MGTTKLLDFMFNFVINPSLIIVYFKLQICVIQILFVKPSMNIILNIEGIVLRSSTKAIPLQAENLLLQNSRDPKRQFTYMKSGKLK
jgi:hypothetical protein